MKHNDTFLRYMKMMGNRLPGYLLAIVMMTAFSALFDVAGSVFVKFIFDIAQSGDIMKLYYVLPVNMIAALFSIMIAVIFMNLYNNEAKRASVEVKQKVFAKSMLLPMKYYDTHHSGEIISSLVFDTDKASEIYTSRLRRVLAPIISVLVYVLAMILLNPMMTLVLIILNVLLLLVNASLSKPMKRVAKYMTKQNAVMVEKLSNLIAGMEICKLYDNEHRTEKQYIHANGFFIKAQKRKMCLSSLLESFNVGFDLLCALMFLVVGIYFLNNHMVTIGEVAAIYTMYGALSFRFLQLGKYYPELINCAAYAEKVFAFLEQEEETDTGRRTAMAEEEAVEETGTETGNPYAVEVENLTFAYDDGHKVFEHKTLVIPKDKNVALTGTSGCGKSTLAKLMLGFYPDYTGDIRILGKSLEMLGLEKARKMIAYVPQEPYLFETSILENIRYGRADATDEEVMEAAKRANANEFILMQKNGYHTVISNRGHSLSGGERQRVAIARAILKDAPIILFDEATSALDNESEQLIQEAIGKLKENKTVIMIAHRKATIESADVEIGI
ncbi:MAG: ABC transporter ATP-binding protein/permease [Lachnospiraceae bacterium]|nr:ABC transporter ATP-binding protein/permease [Lachnospiraceae bacterium]